MRGGLVKYQKRYERLLGLSLCKCLWKEHSRIILMRSWISTSFQQKLGPAGLQGSFQPKGSGEDSLNAWQKVDAPENLKGNKTLCLTEASAMAADWRQVTCKSIRSQALLALKADHLKRRK